MTFLKSEQGWTLYLRKSKLSFQLDLPVNYKKMERKIVLKQNALIIEQDLENFVLEQCTFKQ